MNSSDDFDALRVIRQSDKSARRWRTIAFVIALVAILIGFGTSNFSDGEGTGDSDHIGLVRLRGIIAQPETTVNLINDAAKAERVKALIIHINSPGGTLGGSDALYQAVKKAAAQKPVAVVIDDVAASGGYLAAAAGERIFARETSLVGSIGVYFQWYEGDQLLDKLGLRTEIIKSSVLKGEPSFGSRASTEVRQNIQEQVDQSYKWFKDAVMAERGLSPIEIEKVADARVFMGENAIKLRLIDEIGDVDAAKDWLIDNKGIGSELEVLTWMKDDTSFEDLITRKFFGRLGNALGIEISGQENGVSQVIERFTLDGMLTLWHSGG